MKAPEPKPTGIRYSDGCGRAHTKQPDVAGPCVQHKDFNWKGKRIRYHLHDPREKSGLLLGAQFSEEETLRVLPGQPRARSSSKPARAGR